MKPGSHAENSTIRIRDATKADAAAVAELLADLGYPTSVDEASLRLKEASKGSGMVLLVAEDSTTVLAFCSACLLPYFPNGTWLLRITTLVVHRSARHRRLGTSLIEKLNGRAYSMGASALEVTTSNKREGAHRFYENLGFQCTSRRYVREISG